ncbi:MAG: peptide chain release factor 2 [Treponema sp.]|nr:MAG: peptide chain release factor 2 [Treponema sp.]
MIEEIKGQILELNTKVEEIWRRLDPEALKKQITEREQLSASVNFWDNVKNAEKIMSEIKILKNKFEPWEKLKTEIEDLLAMYDLAIEENNEAFSEEVKNTFTELNQECEKLTTLNMLSGEVDFNNAYLTIHAGAGGTESCDWANILTRMYGRWADAHNFKTKTVDLVEAEGGIKSITIEVKGDYAFGFLKSETGVHRLVRISPFDANSRRHTSFSSVYVFPVLDDTIEVDISPDELRIDTYRASGAGGQHVNKTDSAVRITHLPTGIVAASQSQRSQATNKTTAMNMLKAQLYEYYRQKKEEENSKFASEKKGISWGNQIRSYVFQPYTMVKDHRTSFETGNIQAVMDGEIDGFIKAYLNNNWEKREALLKDGNVC